MDHVTHLLSSADISIYSLEISKFAISRIEVILLTFFESVKIVLLNMVIILMMAGKMATLGLLKIKLFEIKVMTS